jgi:hypothetical protein
MIASKINKPLNPRGAKFMMKENGIECDIPPVPQATIDSLRRQAVADSIKNATEQ